MIICGSMAKPRNVTTIHSQPTVTLAWCSNHKGDERCMCLQAASCVLAVGHASRDVRQQGEGCITLWTLKDPLRPMNVISTPAGVTSIAWSKRTPVHVAVGLRSGIMAIYDARQQQATTPPISNYVPKTLTCIIQQRHACFTPSPRSTRMSAGQCHAIQHL